MRTEVLVEDLVKTLCEAKKFRYIPPILIESICSAFFDALTDAVEDRMTIREMRFGEFVRNTVSGMYTPHED